MKRMKNLLSLVLALVMVMAMTLTAMAESIVDVPEDHEKTITINNTESGHTYEAYQIFTGKLAKQGNTEILSNIEWGSGVLVDENVTDATGAVTKKGLMSELKDLELEDGSKPFEACMSARDVAEALGRYTELDNEVARNFAEIISRHLSDVPGNHKESEYTENKTDATKSYYTISGLDVGYYFVQDKESSLAGKNTTYTRYILDVVGNTAVTPKGEKPSVEKKVKDVNDSTGEKSGWQDSADYDIGDEIEYQLSGKLPSNYADYKQYYIRFVDELSKGLDFVAVSRVYVATKDMDTNEFNLVKELAVGDYVVVNERNLEDGILKLTITIDDLKEVEKKYNDLTIISGYYIVVEYSARLNNDAKIGAEGNKNTVKLEYSNNPNQEAGGTPDKGETPPDTVIVFTFDTTVFKVDGMEQPLEGAEFTLEKLVKHTGNNPATDDVEEDGYEVWEAIGKKEGTRGDIFTFSGLDDGYYRLTETTTPPGYNSIDPIYFAIVATHAAGYDESSGVSALTELKINKLKLNEDKTTYGLDGEFDKVTDDITFAITLEPNTILPETADGHTITTNIVNQKGVTLPETGGIGTTIFTVSGIILVIIAGVLLVTKKRMSKEE